MKRATFFAKEAWDYAYREAQRNARNIARRGIVYCPDRSAMRWADSEKRALAKEMVHASHIPSKSATRQLSSQKAQDNNPLNDIARAPFWGLAPCAVDKVHYRSPEEAFAMRQAVVIPRNANQDLITVGMLFLKIMGKVFRKFDDATLMAFFEVAIAKEESRSVSLITDLPRLRAILTHPEFSIQHPQVLVRLVEFVGTPLGIIASNYQQDFCRIEAAKKSGIDTGDLEGLIRELPILGDFRTDYIKGEKGPLKELKYVPHPGVFQPHSPYIETNQQFLEILDSSDEPKVVKIRRMLVDDKSGRSRQLFVLMNLPHYFDMSGTIPALLQAIVGVCHLAGRKDLVQTREQVENVGMMYGGCNFHKSGFHSLYECLVSIHWFYSQTNNQEFLLLEPMEIVEDTHAVLKRLVTRSSPHYEPVCKMLDVQLEHTKEIYEENLEHEKMLIESGQKPVNL